MAILDRPIRIVHLTDFHVTDGKMFCEDVFRKGAEMINNIDADLYIMTGDVTDAGLRPEYEEAQEMLKEALILDKAHENIRGIALDLYHLTQVAFETGDTDNVEIFGERARPLLEKLDLRSEINKLDEWIHAVNGK